nr:transposase, Ptta/En/Spm, transposase, Tnp1/En/Spm-like protein [Tanacetum cinerariifolium]
MKSLALKAKKESGDEECLTSGSEDEEYAMAVRDFKKFLKRRGRQEPKNILGGSWSDSGEEDDEKAKYETCLVAQESIKVYYESSYFSDENSSIDDFTLDSEYDKL